MKITRNTPEQLVIAHTPWLIGLMLVVFILVFVGVGLSLLAEEPWAGLLFAFVGGGVGFAAFAAFVRRVQVIFDRPANALIMRSRNLMGYSEVRHELSSLSRAELEETTGSKGTVLYRPVLVLDSGMSAGTHPVVEVYTNGTGPRRAVEAINAWLSGDTS